MNTLKRIKIFLGAIIILSGIISLSFSIPEDPNNCLGKMTGPYPYQLVITGACYFNMQLIGDVWTCNINEIGFCGHRYCYPDNPGCSFHRYAEPIVI
jgi:hypothetical protein